MALRQVVLDRQWAGVQSFLVQLLAQRDDLVLQPDGDLRRSAVRGGRLQLERLVTAGPVADDLFGLPLIGHVDRRGHRSDRQALHQLGIYGIAGTVHEHHLSRCPRCPGTWCPLRHGTGHLPLRSCHVSRHRKRPEPAVRGVSWFPGSVATPRLVVTLRIDHQLAQQFSGGGVDDPDVQIRDQ